MCVEEEGWWQELTRKSRGEQEHRDIKKKGGQRELKSGLQRSLAWLLPTCLWCLSGDPLTRQLRLSRR